MSKIEGLKQTLFSGISGAAKAFRVLEVCQHLQQPAWVFTRGPKEEESFVEDLRSLGKMEVYLFPAWEVMPHKDVSPQKEIVAERLDTLNRLRLWKEGSQEKPLIIVTSVDAVLFKILSTECLKRLSFSIHQGQKIEKRKFLEELVRLGFEAFPMVGQKGEFSHRGGIVDFFPLNRLYPVRVEFFANEIESIREFDPETQRSRQKLQSVDLFLAEEKDFLLNSRPSDLSHLIDHGTGNFLIFLDEPEELKEKVQASENLFFEDKGEKKDYLIHPWRSFLKKAAPFKQFSFFALPREGGEQLPYLKKIQSIEAILPLKLKSLFLQEGDMIHAKSHQMIQSIKDWISQKYEITIFCNNSAEEERLKELLEEIKEPKKSVKTRLGRLSAGFALPEEKKIYLTDEEIFGRYKIRRSRWKFRGASVDFPSVEMKEGDFVVHVNYGIGRYKGLVPYKDQGDVQEMMEIEYADHSKLYVPLIDSHLVELYQGFSERKPLLDKIGSSRWQKTKIKVERAIRDYAGELLHLQGERQILEGTSFSSDTQWQKEFEAAFIYEETPDQFDAIEAVKRDMETPKPMDRLLCGDVGYGKTEVAIRAAFKAVMDGKQVAVLVPTTVLAQQHGRTFSERVADYPLIVETLSRFKSKGEQKKILKALKAGKIDILIGTHRLVQPDVEFKELGLVIIDEEQRFGVRHKERLKKLRRLTDVLTMTATPIPRTLYLSLIGVKDMSAIQTPPVDRLPIETHLVEFNVDLIREAILREMNREGQVFFVHNRVESIEKMKKEIERIVPEARIDLAHGQMHADELESVMRSFVNGELDVLVCTTIIESGLDIPNANTIFINRADRFGLAELYQLRGRVGRFKHKAYAYLLLPTDRVILQEAKKRLKALMEYPSLGAGFKVAMKDLEIRGAGNILGEEQSGHVVAIGFDLYCKLLRRTVDRLRESKVVQVSELRPELKECQVRLGFEGKIPVTYIPDFQQRLKIYRRIGEAQTLEELEPLRMELKDRYGIFPQEVEHLLTISEIRISAMAKGLDSIELKESKLLLKRGKEYLLPSGGWHRIHSSQKEKILSSVKKALSQFVGK